MKFRIEEPSLIDVICYGMIVLFGDHGKDWEYYETDPDWLAVRLWTRRN